MSTRDYTWTLGAGESVSVSVAGANSIYFTDGESSIDIHLDGIPGGKIKPGMGKKEPKHFNDLRITTEDAQRVTVYIGDGDIVDNRFTVEVAGALLSLSLDVASHIRKINESLKQILEAQ